MVSPPYRLKFIHMARRGVSLNINALSTLLFFVTLLLVVGYYFITQRYSRSSRMGGNENEEA